MPQRILWKIKIWKLKLLLLSGKISAEKNNNIAISFVSLSYFCLDTKVPKNQGKKNSARSAKQLSGSNKTRKRQAVLQEPLSCLSFTAPPPLLFARPARVLRGGTSSFWLAGLLFEKQNRILDYQGLLIVFDGLYFLPDNNNLRYIQELLGHKSIKTTEIYTHVTEKSLKNIISPFDT